MPQSTPKLGLVCYDLVNDGGVYFSVFRNTLAGYTNSALTKIDDFALRIDNDVTQLKLNPPIVRVSAIKTDDFLYEVVGVTEITEYRNNVYINLSLDFTNIGTVSLNINNLGQKGVYKIGNDGLIANLSVGDLKQNKMNLFRYNGTYWIWVNAVTSDQLNVVGTAGNLTKISTNNTLEDSGVTFSNTTTNNALAQRTASGQIKGVNPINNDDLTNKAYVDTKAPINSPTLTGSPLAPTATIGTNTTQIATTAFVNSEINNDRPYGTATSALVNGGTGVVGTSTKIAREDHTHTMPISVLQSQVINDLTTGGETNVLSAEQGKVINSAIGQIADDRGYVTAKQVIDFNLAIENGKYTAYDALHAPILGGYTFVFNVTKEATGVVSQIAHCVFGTPVGRMFIRHLWGTWSAWKEVATTESYVLQLSDLRNGWGMGEPILISKSGNIVTISGYVTGGTTSAGTIILNIPASFRPSGTKNLILPNYTFPNAPINNYFELRNNGDLITGAVASQPSINITLSYTREV